MTLWYVNDLAQLFVMFKMQVQFKGNNLKIVAVIVVIINFSMIIC